VVVYNVFGNQELGNHQGLIWSCKKGKSSMANVLRDAFPFKQQTLHSRMIREHGLSPVLVLSSRWF